jgi:serine/threonine-protein kinase
MEKGEEPTPEKKKSPTKRNLNVEDTAGNKSVKLKTMAEGTILNRRYEIIRRIGGGGMGAVYLASDKNLGGVLRAVKEMIQAYVDEEQQQKAIDDFKRESLLLTSLEHPSIPTIYDYFFDETAGRFYLVMKYISGGDLAARLRAAPDGRIDERSITEWGLQIADVLDYLHNHNPPIIYRDLKPANVMLDGNNGRAMLIDFGIARWLNAEEKGVTAVGTMGYAPPELFSGQADNRSDIYSLGATMFHLLTGSDPQNNPLLIFDFNKNPRPRQINPLISNEMEQIILRAVEYNPSLRFNTAAEMRDQLFEHTERIRSGRLTYSYTGSGSVAPPIVQQNLVFCGFCGEKIIPTDMFCAYCGTKQPLQEASGSQPIAQPRYTARVVVLGTSEINPPAIFLEKDNNLVGRKDPHSNIFPEVDLSRYDPQVKVSRRHARIWLQGENYMIEDLGSSNGTMLVNSLNEAVRLFPHQPHVLTHGDKLKLGETTLHFFAG